MTPPPPGSSDPRERIRAAAVIPARLASQRLPGKMLLAETGLPLVVHTARNVSRSGAFERVVVATDDEGIAAAVRAHDHEAVLTRADHPSGTDRVHEAVGQLGADFDVVVNVQGDEPELDPTDLGRLVAAFSDPAVELATLAGPLAPDQEGETGAWEAPEANTPQVVKVVCDSRGDALYFSRAKIPHRAHGRGDKPDWSGLARRHVGVYAFRPAALSAFCALPPGVLERTENLEQLRWLEAGRRIRVLDTDHVPLGIDTRSDYDAFVLRAAAAERPGQER